MNIISNIQTFINNARHILYVSYKPTSDRYKRTAKIIILGIMLAGVLGLIIATIVSLLVYGNLSFI